MGKDKERAELLAKIEAAWPHYKQHPELVRSVELASNDQLKNHLALAQIIRDTEQAKPRPEIALSPRHSDSDRELFRRIHSLRWSLDGGYTLAHDECGDWYVGPRWVPFNLYSNAEFYGHSPGAQDCARILVQSAGAEKLWGDILSKYGRPHSADTGLSARQNNHADNIAAVLPVVCAEAKAGWALIPPLRPSEYKKQRDELARRAEQLALELERFYLSRDPDDCELPGLFDFRELMTQEELDRFDQAIRITTARIANRARNRAGLPGLDWEEYNDIGEDARALGYGSNDLHTMARIDAVEVYGLMERDHTQPHLPYGGVPTLPDMLRRIARKFEEDGKCPPIKNPNLANAERNFFTRVLCKYFWTSYGDVSPAIVRDIVTMFYPQSITENDVSQMISKIKVAHPLPES